MIILVFVHYTYVMMWGNPVIVDTDGGVDWDCYWVSDSLAMGIFVLNIS